MGPLKSLGQNVKTLLPKPKNPAQESVNKLKLQTKGFAKNDAQKLLDGKRPDALGKTLLRNVKAGSSDAGESALLGMQSAQQNVNSMYGMMSNMSKSAHDMQMRAIRNMR